jgi:hypothetical protein
MMARKKLHATLSASASHAGTGVSSQHTFQVSGIASSIVHYEDAASHPEPEVRHASIVWRILLLLGLGVLSWYSIFALFRILVAAQ